ncbi:MAG: ATP-binding protein [Akkermansia sp.]
MTHLDITLVSLLILSVFGWAYREGKFTMILRLKKKKYAELEKKSALFREHYLSDRQAVLEALGDAFLVTDRHGRVLIANAIAKRLLGTAGSVGGNVFHSINHAALHDFYREIFKSFDHVARKITVTIESAEQSPTQEMVLQVVSTPLQENPDQIGILFHDITEEHRTQIVRRDFVANASHELRTPLTIIHGYLENLLEGDEMSGDQDMRNHVLSLMQKHTNRIIRIVEDMLVISKLEGSETGRLKWKTFDLSACVEDVVGRLESMARERQVDIQLDIAPSEFPLYGDKFYWTQILFNLMENAMKQNPDPGLRLTVGARVEEDNIHIWVADTGIGIPAAHIPYIFNRFYRVETQHSSQIKGTGLGLSIVRRAVEAHKGTINVSSTPGVETRFTISLPLTTQNM